MLPRIPVVASHSGEFTLQVHVCCWKRAVQVVSYHHQYLLVDLADHCIVQCRPEACDAAKGVRGFQKNARAKLVRTQVGVNSPEAAEEAA